MPTCPEVVRELPALPPWPDSRDMVQWVVRDDPKLVEFAAISYLQLKAALRCIEEHENGYARLDH